MDFELEQCITGHLDPGERVVWIGRPGQGLRLTAGDGVLVPFSLMWGGFAIFWEFMAFRDNGPFFFRLWGVPFVVVGLYMIGGRFFWDAYRRRGTLYVVTNSRIIIIDGVFQQKTRILPLKALGELTFTERRDGSGDISFGSSPPGHRFVGRSWPGSGTPVPTFEFLPNVREIFDTIRRAQQQAA